MKGLNPLESDDPKELNYRFDPQSFTFKAFDQEGEPVERSFMEKIKDNKTPLIQGSLSLANAYLNNQETQRNDRDRQGFIQNIYGTTPIWDYNEMYGDNTSGSSQFQPIIKAEKGAKVRTMLEASAPINVEKGEFIILPDGTTEVIRGKKHKDGGVDTILPEGSIIYSNKLKPIGETKTFAQKAKDLDFSKYLEILKNPFSDPATINTATKMIDRNKKKLATLFQDQQIMNGDSSGEPMMMNGGYTEYEDGGINIKPENRGKFTEWAKSKGMGVQEAASKVMSNKEDYSSTIVKRANFAKNAANWSHEKGGYIKYEDGGMIEYGDGGYVVTRSNDRKGKTHKVTGPDGTVKYFGDSKMGQHPEDPERKAAFYARHKSNLENNPYFRAFARKTWEKGGTVDNDKEMVEGVADILSRVDNLENRKELASYMTNQFDNENVNYDYDQFLEATNLMENKTDLNFFEKGGMIKRADGSYSKRGLWDNIRDNKGSGNAPTPEMLKQERKIKNKMEYGGKIKSMMEDGGIVEGQELDLTEEEIEQLKKQGFKFKII